VPPPTGPRITAVVADGDPLARRAVRSALQAGAIAVAAEAATCRDTIELTSHYRPDVLVLDLVLPGGDGLDVIRHLHTAVEAVGQVVFTSTRDDESAIAALRAGASGYLTKDMPIESLPRAVRAVAAGEPAVSRRLVRTLIERLRAVPASDVGLRPVRSPLTTRQWEVLDLLCDGASTEAIAASLYLSEETVRSHIKHILRTVGVRSRKEAVAAAASMRLPRSAD
jgi:NarL family two-component system response regulator LiaR